MPDGRLLLPLCASDVPSGPKDYAKEAYLGYLTSRDGGRTWGELRKSGPFGGIPFFLLHNNEPCCVGETAPLADATCGPFHDGGSPLQEGQRRAGPDLLLRDRGEPCLEGVHRIEPIPFNFPMAYRINAIFSGRSHEKTLFICYCFCSVWRVCPCSGDAGFRAGADERLRRFSSRWGNCGTR